MSTGIKKNQPKIALYNTRNTDLQVSVHKTSSVGKCVLYVDAKFYNTISNKL